MKKINWRYALGELIIVTVGVSLAFALNAWAQENREKERMERYLKGILDDLESDRVLLDSTIALTQVRLNSLYAMMPYLQGKVTGRDTVIGKFFTLIDPVTFNPHEASVNALMESGDLSLFDDLAFKNSLFEHYDHYRAIDKEYERHMNFSKDYIASYFMEKMDYSTMFTNPDYSFVEERYFKNLVFSLMGVYRLSLEKQKAALESLNRTTELIDTKKI